MMNLFTGFLIDNEAYMSQLVTFYDKYQTRVLSCLPWVAAELANNSGFSAMIQIIQRYGGRKLYIATNKHDFNKKLNLNLSDIQHHRIIRNLGITEGRLRNYKKTTSEVAIPS